MHQFTVQAATVSGPLTDTLSKLVTDIGSSLQNVEMFYLCELLNPNGLPHSTLTTTLKIVYTEHLRILMYSCESLSSEELTKLTMNIFDVSQ